MANTASAKKQARESAKRAQRNRSVKSAVKTHVVRVRRALTEGTDGVEQLAVTAIRNLDRAASKGILHRNNAARRKSRLMKRLATAASSAAAPAEAKKPARPKAAAKSAPKRAAAKKSS